MTTADPEAIDRRTISGLIANWINAVELQETRVIAEKESAGRTQIDAAFLAVALRNLLRAVELARKLEPEQVGRAFSDFDRRVPNAKDVRNLLEHFDEYMRGTGRLQKQRTLGAHDYVPYYVRYEDQYLLHVADGYELDVRSAVHAAGNLADEVQNALVGRSERFIWEG